VVCGVEEGVSPVKFYLLYLERVLFIVACEESYLPTALISAGSDTFIVDAPTANIRLAIG
jgi:hypothetical protein